MTRSYDVSIKILKDTVSYSWWHGPVECIMHSTNTGFYKNCSQTEQENSEVLNFCKGQPVFKMKTSNLKRFNLSDDHKSSDKLNRLRFNVFILKTGCSSQKFRTSEFFSSVCEQFFYRIRYKLSAQRALPGHVISSRKLYLSRFWWRRHMNESSSSET